MLSEKRREILKNNADNIKGLKSLEMSGAKRKEDGCKYKYDDGCVCAAGACMTDGEMSFVDKPQYRAINFVSVSKFGDFKLVDNELDIITKFQVIHDCAMAFYAGERQVWNLAVCLKSLIETGILDSRVIPNESGYTFDKFYSKDSDGNWYRH